MHKCPVNGCVKKVPYSMLMCLRHWRMVPKSLADRVWREWRKEKHSDSHQMACQAAVDAVNEAVGMEERADSGKGKD